MERALFWIYPVLIVMLVVMLATGVADIEPVSLCFEGAPNATIEVDAPPSVLMGLGRSSVSVPLIDQVFQACHEP